MAIPALFWETVHLASEAIESDSDIWGIIQNDMQKVGLTNVKKNASDVNGHSQDTIVAVTFVKLAPKNYMLVVMAAGNNALALRDQLSNLLKKTAFL